MRGVEAVALALVVAAMILAPPTPVTDRAARPPGPPASSISTGRQACSGTWQPTPNSTSAAASSGPRRQPMPPSSTWQAHDAEGLWIVRFRQYRMAGEHRAELESALATASSAAAAGLHGWSWVERRNAAMRFPTDFGLLRIAGHAGPIKAALEALAFVKDVHPERRLTRSLLHQEEGSRHAEQQQEEQQAAAAAWPPSEGQFSPCDAGASSGVGGDEHCMRKRPGRLQTRPTFSLDGNVPEQQLREPDAAWPAGPGHARIGNGTVEAAEAAAASRRRKLLQRQGENLATLLGADRLWAAGFRGQKVRMGVFDTGIKANHPHVKNIRERTNWTHEPTLEDGLGHGSFVAGVVAGSDAQCPGLAPEVELHTFRVFTNDQVSFTSWFLDAFNYAIATKMNIVNLSIGGPDYLDAPFVEKVWEITSNGIIMVSAIGNDGPLYGTLNNPADMNDVIGVGAIDFGGHIAPFSSRGMSTWEIPLGYGRPKPDVMGFGRDVLGSRIGGGCRSLSGTSVASPVVAGAVCLLASVVPEEKRWAILNPASMKQALVEGAVRLPKLNMFEQGQGRLDVPRSRDILLGYQPRASVVPAALNLTDCPYAWPFCTQPLYAHAMPLMFNATILNGMGLTGKLEAPPIWTPSDAGGRLLDVRFEYSDQLWPWSGYLALYIRVLDEGASFSGSAGGEVKFTVVSPPAPGETEQRRSTIAMPITAAIIPTPPREKRLLWEQFHSIRYPPAYFPRDDLQVKHDILDWHGDHPHTNYHDMYNSLRGAGYFLEVLASPATCFNASNYGALLIVDSEEEWYLEEINKLENDVRNAGLGLVVFADWYHKETVAAMRFYDDNTRSWWDAATGGANVPALNDLLTPYGAALEGAVLDAEVSAAEEHFSMASGTAIKAWPAGGWLHTATVNGKIGKVKGQSEGIPVLGLLQHGAGRLAVYGDSNCLDSSHQRSNCYGFLHKLAAWAAGGDGAAHDLAAPGAGIPDHYGHYEGLPSRRDDYDFAEISRVLQEPIRCYPNAPLELQGATFGQWKRVVGRPARVNGTASQPGGAGAASGTNGNRSIAEQQLAQRQKEAAALAEKQAAEAAAAKQKLDQQAAAEKAAQVAAAAAQQVQQAAAAQKAAQEAAAAAQQARQAVAAQKEAQQAQQQAQQAAATQQHQHAAGGAIPGKREHPELDTLAQAGQELPRKVDPDPRPKVAADGGAGAGTGGAQQQQQQRQQGAAATRKAAAGGASLPWQARQTPRSAVVQLSQFFAVAGGLAVAALWAVSRRRRGAVLGGGGTNGGLRRGSRGWLLPLWGPARQGREE